MKLSHIKALRFSFSEAFQKAYVYTVPIEKGSPKLDITANLYEMVVGLFFKKPGVITAPDGSDFLVTLELLPASAEAKKAAILHAQQYQHKRNVLDALPGVGEALPPGPDWASGLTADDELLFQRIAAARANGTRITFRAASPNEFRILLTPAPRGPKPFGQKGEVLVQPQPSIGVQSKNAEDAAAYVAGAIKAVEPGLTYPKVAEIVEQAGAIAKRKANRKPKA